MLVSVRGHRAIEQLPTMFTLKSLQRHKLVAGKVNICESASVGLQIENFGNKISFTPCLLRYFHRLDFHDATNSKKWRAGFVVAVKFCFTIQKNRESKLEGKRVKSWNFVLSPENMFVIVAITWSPPPHPIGCWGEYLWDFSVTTELCFLFKMKAKWGSLSEIWACLALCQN